VLKSNRIRHSLILLGLVLLASILSCGKAIQRPPPEPSAFAARVKSVLPPTWALEENSQDVIIRRQEPVTTYSCVGLDVNLLVHPDLLKQFVDTNGAKDDYQIRLRRTAKLDLSEYLRLKAANNQIVVNKGTIISSRQFYEDDAMRSFDSRYRELPEYYDDSASIYLETTMFPWDCIYPNSVAKECEIIRQKLDSLFSRYSRDDYPRTLSRGID
jgi:hypothetical protein